MLPAYPFSAIVGQDQLKLGLMLNAVNPAIGGMLIRGEKGTGKSTAVRALAALLPEQTVVRDCPFNCDPDDRDRLCPQCLARGGDLPRETRPGRVVELPINATEDRVAGTLDLTHVLKTGEKRFEPGLLAAAHRAVLYVDEVNLLDDHIVDILLDSAAMGVNIVEREGVGYSHPARFILVGTMNPEEGDLRPHLLDRFGLCAAIGGIEDRAGRVALIRRRHDFENDPEAFLAKFAPAEQTLKARIAEAGRLLGRVTISDGILSRIADISLAVGVDGHRADLVMMKAAAARAALEGRTEVGLDDVLETASLALYHRVRRQPFDETGLDMNLVRMAAEKTS
jgi:Mg-chelatase subunit ChlI